LHLKTLVEFGVVKNTLFLLVGEKGNGANGRHWGTKKKKNNVSRRKKKGLSLKDDTLQSFFHCAIISPPYVVSLCLKVVYKCN